MFEYSQSSGIKVCYKPYTKGENKDSYRLNFKRPYCDSVQNKNTLSKKSEFHQKKVL